MPRTILTTLTAADYSNLQQNYSEKNIINQTNGNEFIISTASKTTLVDINNRSTNVTVANVTSWTPTSRVTGEFGWYNRVGQEYLAYLREEWIYTSGFFWIETDQIIADKNSVSINWQLKYDNYLDDHAVPFTSADYNNEYARYASIAYSNWKQNHDGYVTASEELPYEHAIQETSREWWEFFWGANTTPVSSSFPENSVTFSVTKLANNHYKIVVNYRIVTWWGFNYVKGNVHGLTESRKQVFDTKEIDFTLTANTVAATEVEFNYSRPANLRGGAKGKNYEMESNEFLQTNENTSPSARPSAIVSAEIFDKFDNDRMIVSFLLLNCEKYIVDNNSRYLQAEDLIYIKDENGQYLGEDLDATGEITPSVFEVVKTRPIWDGTFSMEVTCRQIDMTT